MKSWSSRVAIFVIHLMAFLPLWFAQWIGIVIGMCVWYLRLPMRDIVMTNVFLCYPHLSHRKRLLLAKRIICETGKTLCEMSMAWVWPIDKSLKKIRGVDGEHYLIDAAKSEQGLVLIVPHFGNWEVLNQFLHQYFEMTVMYRPQKSPVFDRWMKGVRSRQKHRLVPTDRSGVMALFKTLKVGGTTAILPDQVPEKSGGSFAPFFGIPTFTSRLASQLVNKSNAQALSVAAKRLPNGEGFDVVVQKAHPDLFSKDLPTSIEGLNKTVESCIALAPEQYQWGYKRFKRTPYRGKLSVYREPNLY